MIKCGEWNIGVCSWSLQTDVAGVAEAMKKIGINAVHLAVRPALENDGAEYLANVKKQDWQITSTMIDFPQEDYSSMDSIKVTGGIVPDDCWERNQELFTGAIDITRELGVQYLSMHAGFLDHSDAEYAAKFYSRIKALADAAGKKGVMLLLETGQETAEELRIFLEELNHPSVGVNFDPANMILYDEGEPVEALGILSDWIKHVHIKDGNRTEIPGTWGEEVVWGQGQVGADNFLGALRQIGFSGALAVEREAGDNRLEDVRTAVERLSAFGG